MKPSQTTFCDFPHLTSSNLRKSFPPEEVELCMSLPLLILMMLMAIDDCGGYCRIGQVDDLMEQFEDHSLQSLMTCPCQ